MELGNILAKKKIICIRMYSSYIICLIGIGGFSLDNIVNAHLPTNGECVHSIENIDTIGGMMNFARKINPTGDVSENGETIEFLNECLLSINGF